MRGFSKKETNQLVNDVASAKKKGIPLTQVFEDFALTTSRKKGSVRNFYYMLLKSDSEIIKKNQLSAQRVQAFTKAEERTLLEQILSGVKEGKSVRRAIIDISKGDDKLALRMQNKYRNLVTSSPEFVKEVSESLKLKKLTNRNSRAIQPHIEKLSEEIDRLVEKLNGKIKEENKRLMTELRKLKAENAQLRLKEGTSIVSDYFKTLNGTKERLTQ